MEGCLCEVCLELLLAFSCDACPDIGVMYRIGQEPPPQEEEAPYDPRSLYEVYPFRLTSWILR
jgi:hypothetical protein